MDSLDRQIDRYIEMVKQGDRNIDRQIGYKVRYNRTAQIDIQIDKYSSSEWSNMGIETQIDRKVNRQIQMETLSPIGIMRRKNIMGSFDIDLDQGADFKNNQTTKRLFGPINRLVV